MCCVLEIGMLIFGIVTLVKGTFTMSKTKVVTGAPAYVIGAILTAAFPMILFVAFAIGIVVGLQNPEAAQRGEVGNGLAWSLIDVFGVLIPLGLVMAISTIYGRDPLQNVPSSSANYPSYDPLSPLGPPTHNPFSNTNNPYDPPSSR